MHNNPQDPREGQFDGAATCICVKNSKGLYKFPSGTYGIYFYTNANWNIGQDWNSHKIFRNIDNALAFWNTL